MVTLSFLTLEPFKKKTNIKTPLLVENPPLEGKLFVWLENTLFAN